MEDNEGAKDTTWPTPKFRFEVDLGAEFANIAFQEVSGMDTENQVIEFRESNKKMPGIVKYGNITMKRGIFVNDNTFWNWHDQIQMNTIKRRTLTIKLLDENGTVTMKWTLKNAWPVKITRADLKSDGNEVAVESLEIAHERIIISKGV